MPKSLAIACAFVFAAAGVVISLSAPGPEPAPAGRWVPAESPAADGVLGYAGAFVVDKDAGGSEISHVGSNVYSRDGSRLLSGASNGDLQLWDTREGRMLRRIDGPDAAVLLVKLEPDDRHAVIVYGNGDVRRVDTESGETVATANVPGPVAATFARDAGLLAVASTNSVHVLTLPDLGVRQVVELSGDTIQGIALRPDGGRVAAATAGGRVNLWDLPSGGLVRTHEANGGPLYAVAYHPQGTQYAAGGQDRILRLWDDATGSVVAEMPGHEFWITAISFSPDGTMIVSGDESCDMGVFDLRSLTKVQGFKHHNECWITEVAWSPNDDVVIGCRPNGYYGGAGGVIPTVVGGANISGFVAAQPGQVVLTEVPTSATANDAVDGTIYLGLVAGATNNSAVLEAAKSMEICQQESRRQGAYAINCWRVKRTNAAGER